MRTQPVGATLVGGKESYKAACDDCWYENDPFINPELFLADPTWWSRRGETVLGTLGETPEAICWMESAALTALRKGLPLHASCCAACNHLHLDSGVWAERAHKKHLCLKEGCKMVTPFNISFVGNPLALFGCTLDPKSNKLAFPDDPMDVSKGQVPLRVGPAYPLDEP